MVGVPRSQGCKQCRKKKKGCNLQRPKCGNCSRLGVDCEYLQRQWTFISTDAAPNIPAVSAETKVVQDQSLNCTALEIQVLDEFWTRYLPTDPYDTIYVDDIGLAPWCRPVQNLSAWEDWPSSALKAVAFMAIGRIDRKQNYVRHARRLYVRSLRQTNKALQDPTRITKDATLACCKLLGIYEAYRLEEDGSLTTQGTDWQSHVEGTCRIIELRGPDIAASANGHALYQDAMAMAAIGGITRRKARFFRGGAWSIVPWIHHPKNVRDELFDMFMALPDLLERQDHVFAQIQRASTKDDNASVLITGIALLHECILLAGKLQAWEEKLLALAYKDSTINTKIETAPTSLSDICTSHGYGFFYLCNQYWTIVLTLAGSTHMLRSKLCHPTSPTSLPTLPTSLNPQTFATHIAQRASHFFRPEAGLWAMQVCTVPMGAAFHYYAATGQARSEGMTLLQTALRRGGAAKHGMAEDFLRSIAADAAAAAVGAPQDVRGDPRNAAEHEKMARRWYDSTITGP